MLHSTWYNGITIGCSPVNVGSIAAAEICSCSVVVSTRGFDPSNTGSNPVESFIRLISLMVEHGVHPTITKVRFLYQPY